MNGREEWRENWPVPVASSMALAVSVIPIYSLGALMSSIHATTGWARSQISIGLTLISLCTVFLSPVVGAAIDRYGSRKVGLPGIALYCSALASIGFVGQGIVTWWVAWLLVAITYASIRTTVWTAAVIRLFRRSRGLALGVTISGLGVGSTALPYLTTLLQEHYGWRGAYFGLAGGAFLLVFPLLWFSFDDRGERRQSEQGAPGGYESVGVTWRKALSSRSYFQMAVACLCTSVPSTAFVVHFVPIVRSEGLSSHIAAVMAGAIGIAFIIGSLCGGFLLDRYNGALIGSSFSILPVASGPVLLFHQSEGAVLFAATMIGLAAGSEVEVLAYLIPRYFGSRQFGLLFGVMNGVITLGLGIGPIMASYLFDRYGSYRSFLISSVPLFALGAVLFGTLGKPEVEEAI